MTYADEPPEAVPERRPADASWTSSATSSASPIHYYAAVDLDGLRRPDRHRRRRDDRQPAGDQRSRLRRLDGRPPSASTCRPAAITSTARRRSPTPARGRAPATTTSPGPAASSSSCSRCAARDRPDAPAASAIDRQSPAPRRSSTNFPQDRISEMSRRGSGSPGDDSIKPSRPRPALREEPAEGNTRRLPAVLDMERLAKLSVDLFGQDSRYDAASSADGPGVCARNLVRCGPVGP